MLRTTFTTSSCLSRNVASIGNDMKNVCMALHRRISMPSPGGSDLVPMRPFILAKSVRATLARTPITTAISSLSERFFRIDSGWQTPSDASHCHYVYQTPLAGPSKRPQMTPSECRTPRTGRAGISGQRPLPETTGRRRRWWCVYHWRRRDDNWRRRIYSRRIYSRRIYR